MVAILLTGHGGISSGIYSSLKMVFGVNDNIKYVDFLESDTAENLKEKLSKEVDNLLQNNEGVLCLTDLTGGTPFRTCCELSLSNEKIKVISGMNIPMLISVASEMDDISLEEAAQTALESGRDEITLFKFEKRVEVEEEDGI